MTSEERIFWQQWLEENAGIMFQIKWFRIILDEAQYLSHRDVPDAVVVSKILMFEHLWLVRL
jgi:hypothetical protein